jgi:hypothetical protein
MRRAKLPTADQSYREFKQKEREPDDFLYPRGKPPPAPTLPPAVVRTVAVLKKPISGHRPQNFAVMHSAVFSTSVW